MVYARTRWKRASGTLWILALILLFCRWASLLPRNRTTSNAYVFYATKNEYACSAAVNIHRLRYMFNTKHRIIVLVSSGVSEEYISIFNDLQATVFKETPPPLFPGGSNYYTDCLLKLLSFKIHELDPSVRRILTLDSDQLILKNIDSVFNGPSVDLAAPPAYWLKNGTLASTCMLIKPNPRLWNQVNEAIKSVTHAQYDMDLVNNLFQDRAYRLPGSYVTINSHWEDRSVPTWFQSHQEVPFPAGEWARPASDNELEQLYLQSHIIHFTAVGKPWSINADSPSSYSPKNHPLLYEQWRTWRSAAMRICPTGLF